MKRLSLSLLVALFLISTAFTSETDQVLYPELTQSFKLLKKNTGSISYDRKDVLTGIQQMGIVAKQKKQAVVFEFIGTDGFSAPYAEAVLQAALANLGINDVKVSLSGTAPSEKVAAALTKLGFKTSNDGGLSAKYNDQAVPVTIAIAASNPQSTHVLMNEGAAASLTTPDKFAVKLNYPSLTGATDAQYEQQAKLISTEMMFVAMKIKDNWNY
jgi:hypothetical protein